MNDITKSILRLLTEEEEVAADKKDFSLLSDMRSIKRLVEAESALSLPSCDFTSDDKGRDKIVYMGLFLDKDCLEQALSDIDRDDGQFDKKAVKTPHVTFKYKPEPDEIPKELFGKPFTIVIDGYGYDDENEGVRVRFKSDWTPESKAVEELFSKIPVPHITLSVSESGKAVNTKNVSFHDIKPVEVGCVFGGFVGKGGSQKQKFKTQYNRFDNSPPPPPPGSASSQKTIMEEYNRLLNDAARFAERHSVSDDEFQK